MQNVNLILLQQVDQETEATCCMQFMAPGAAQAEALSNLDASVLQNQGLRKGISAMDACSEMLPASLRPISCRESRL